MGGNESGLKKYISKLLAKSHGQKKMSASISCPRPPLIVHPFASLPSSSPQDFPIGTAFAKFLPSWSYVAPKVSPCFISKLASRTVLEASPLCSPLRTRAADNTHWSVFSPMWTGHSQVYHIPPPPFFHRLQTGHDCFAVETIDPTPPTRNEHIHQYAHFT